MKKALFALPARLKKALAAVGGCLLLTACDSAAIQSTDVVEPLPDGVVAFRYHGNHLYFDATVCDSIPAQLLFDTGATGLHLDSLWFARSGVASGRVMRGVVGGAGTSVVSTRILLDTLAFGIDTLRWRSGLTDILDLKKILGREADGIFGLDFLGRSCVEFDFRRGYMRSVSSDTLAAAGFIRIAAEKCGSNIYFPACVRFDAEHVVSGRFLLDTGCGSAVVLTASAGRKSGFDTFGGKKIVFETVSGGIGGAFVAVLSRAEAVEIGGRICMGVPVSVSLNESGYLSREDVTGVVGNELLQRFDCVVDFGAPALWLRPVPDSDAPFSGVMPGFSVIDRTDICEGWPVTGICKGYAPEGLLPGDTVVVWDGKPVVELRTDAMALPGHHRMTVRHDGVCKEYEVEIKELL